METFILTYIVLSILQFIARMYYIGKGEDIVTTTGTLTFAIILNLPFLIWAIYLVLEK